jgi:hypothetical protein
MGECPEDKVAGQAGGGWPSNFGSDASRQAQLGACATQMEGPRLTRFGVIQRADPHEAQVRSRFGFAEQMHAAYRAETSVHGIAAAGHADIVTQLAFNPDGGARKAHIHGRAASPDVLARTAPAGATGNGAQHRFDSALFDKDSHR